MHHTPQRADFASRDTAQTSSATNLRRRRFLLALGAGTAGTAAATAQAIAPVATATGAATTPEQGRGYQETQHVRDYYASARI